MKTRMYLALALLFCFSVPSLNAQEIESSLAITYVGDISSVRFGTDAVAVFGSEYYPWRVVDQGVYCYRQENGTKAILDVRGSDSFSVSTIVNGSRHRLTAKWKSASTRGIAGWDRLTDLDRCNYARSIVARQFEILAGRR